MDEALANLAVELGKLAIVVVLVESAMSTLFTWRVYRAVFNHRALKTPIMLAVGLMIVWGFGDHIFWRAPWCWSGAMQAGDTRSLLTQVVSAMIIAGGSSGINTLLQNLGLPALVLPDAPPRPQLAATEAWISVQVNGGQPGEAFHVAIAPLATTAGPALAGSVEVKRFWHGVREAWRSESNRFPNYGGWSLEANKGYKIEVVDVRSAPPTSTAVFEGSFAPRAIIDFQVTV